MEEWLNNGSKEVEQLLRTVKNREETEECSNDRKRKLGN